MQGIAEEDIKKGAMEYLDKALEKVKSTAAQTDVEKLKRKTIQYVDKGTNMQPFFDHYTCR